MFFFEISKIFEFLDHNSLLETFVSNIKALINNYMKLKVLIFKNWKWNNITFLVYKIIISRKSN